MRAKIASQANGHAFEKRFLELDPIQLHILYRHAMEEENAKKKEQIDLIKALNDMWVKNFNVYFDELKVFTNPQLYKAFDEMKEMDVHRKEVSADEFPAVWEDMMKVIPRQYVVESAETYGREILPFVDPESERKIAGWVPSKFRRNEGELNGNERSGNAAHLK